MGLDEFKSDDSDSNTSSSNTTSSTDVGPSDPTNKPSFTSATFADDKIATPRQIKYQIKSQGGKWKSQFSRLRMEEGEKVMHSAGVNVKQSNVTIAVFTTIQSEFDGRPYGDQLDIWVVPWDLKQRDNLDEGAYISPEGNWATKLCGAVGHYIDNIDEYIE